MSSMDMSQYLDIFLDEGRESLAVLRTNFLRMEDGDDSQEMLATIFRAAHTLKGSSRAMGFMAIGNLTHEMENLLDDLRNDKLTVSTPIVNALLECRDTLQVMMDGVAATQTDTETGGKNIDDLIALLNGFRTGGNEAVGASAEAKATPATSAETAVSSSTALIISPYELASINDAVSTGNTIYHIGIELHPDCVMKAVRAFMVLSALNQVGSVIIVSPNEDALDAETFDLQIELLFASTKTVAEIEEPLSKISELNRVTVRNWAGEGSIAEEPLKLVLEPYEQTAIHDAKASGLSIYKVHIELIDDCSMKSVRSHMVLKTLNENGSVLATAPKEDLLDAEEFGATFDVICASTKSADELKTELNRISEIQSIALEPWIDQIAPKPTAEPIPVKNVIAEPKSTISTAAASLPNDEDKPSTASPKAVAPVAHQQAQTIRVDVTRLDILLNLVGELVIDRTQIARMGTDLRTRYPQDDCVAQLIDATHRVARITGELQDEIMKTRMLPIDGVFQRMPRMIRDLAQKTGKEVDFQMWGGETELDRGVLEVLGDPLIHLLRNSVDHGIEPSEDRIAAGKPARGTVTLSARYQENHILIEITDDGRGMVPEKLKAAAIRKGLLTEAAAEQMTDKDALSLIFASGFSTAAELSDISGRGVGMDIVKSNLERIGGRIVIDSHVGKGSTFTINLPLTLAIVRSLLVKAGGGTYVVPLGSVVEMLRLGTEEGEVSKRSVSGQASIVLRGRTVPLVNLGELLAGNPEATLMESILDDSYVVIIGFSERQVGLCVDGLIGEQEVVIKSLGKLLGDINGLSGATILGDGSVALIIDPVRSLECLSEMSERAMLAASKRLSVKPTKSKAKSREKELVS